MHEHINHTSALYPYINLAFGMEQDIPEYDMDSEDEIWLTRQVKHLKMEVTPTTFENIMDRLEKASGQTVSRLHRSVWHIHLSLKTKIYFLCFCWVKEHRCTALLFDILFCLGANIDFP